MGTIMYPEWLACNRAFCLCDLLEKNAPDAARAHFVQTEVRSTLPTDSARFEVSAEERDWVGRPFCK